MKAVFDLSPRGRFVRLWRPAVDFSFAEKIARAKRILVAWSGTTLQTRIRAGQDCGVAEALSKTKQQTN
jgi:hypothetical protein